MPPLPGPEAPTPLEVQRAREILAADEAAKRVIPAGGGRFRLIAGKHSEGRGETRKLYKKGDVIISDKDLAAWDPNKFKALQRVRKPTAGADLRPVSQIPEDDEEEGEAGDTEKELDDVVASDDNGTDTLEAMTVAELKAMALEEGIDLGNATLKAQIIAKIQNTRTEE